MHRLFFLKGLHQIAGGEICTKIIRFDANIIKAVKTAMHALKKKATTKADCMTDLMKLLK